MNRLLYSWGIALSVVGLIGFVTVALAGVWFVLKQPLAPAVVYVNEAGIGSATARNHTMMNSLIKDYSKSSYASPGERIYLSATDDNGNRINASFDNDKMPTMGMAIQHNLACANCHGENGHGDLVFPDGAVSADIRWTVLELEGYDASAFRKAVVEGVEINGGDLSPWMPRWTLSDTELSDIKAYLKTL